MCGAAVSRALSGCLRSLQPSNGVWLNLDLQERSAAHRTLHCTRQQLIATDCPLTRRLLPGAAPALCHGAYLTDEGKRCVGGCALLSVDAASALRHVSAVPALRSSVRRLCLFLCKRLTDSDVRCVESWPSLTAVDVGGCHGLTDEALRSIAAVDASGKRRALQWLSLYWCPAFSDKGLQHLTNGLDGAALRHLSLRSAARLHRVAPASRPLSLQIVL